MPELHVGSLRFWYRQGTDRVDPDQSVLVFLHGAGGSSVSWLYQLRALRRTHNCVALDLPGHGKSDDDPNITSIDDYATHVLAALDTLGIQRCAIVGHSLGGAIAIDCVRREPERFDALAGLGVGPLIPVSPLILEALRGSGQLYVRFIEDLAFSPTTPQRFVDKSTAGGLQAAREVVERDFALCSDWDRRGQLAGLTLPTLLLVGRDDAMTPVPLVETLARELPSARLEVVEDAGHMVMIEQHKHVNELLAAFVDELEAAPATPASS